MRAAGRWQGGTAVVAVGAPLHCSQVIMQQLSSIKQGCTVADDSRAAPRACARAAPSGAPWRRLTRRISRLAPLRPRLPPSPARRGGTPRRRPARAGAWRAAPPHPASPLRRAALPAHHETHGQVHDDARWRLEWAAGAVWGRKGGVARVKRLPTAQQAAFSLPRAPAPRTAPSIAPLAGSVVCMRVSVVRCAGEGWGLQQEAPPRPPRAPSKKTQCYFFFVCGDAPASSPAPCGAYARRLWDPRARPTSNRAVCHIS